MKISFIEGQFELASREIAVEEAFLTECADMGIMIHRKVSGEIEADKRIFDLFRAYKLRKTIHRAYSKSRFYRRMFDVSGIRPEDIRSFDDLSIIPYTFPNDIRGNSYDFLCMSERHVERPVTFYSSGTTGLRKRLFFSFRDTQHIKDFIGAAMNSIADTEDTRILSLMTNSQGRGASQVYTDSVCARGMEAWTCSMEDGAEEILRCSLDHRCNVWFGDIGTIYRTAKELESIGTDLASLGLKLLYVTMGNISTHVRNYLSAVFRCPVITHYGLTEVGWGFAVEQPVRNGYFSNELDIYTEIIDPDTGEILPDGQEGELTFTLIGRDAMPLIRYRSGDIASIKRAAGPDELDTIGFIRRRLEGVLICQGGEMITPPMIEEVLYCFPQVIDYRLYADGTGRITIDIEVTDTESELTEHIADAIGGISGAAAAGAPVIRIVPRGELKKYCYEKKRFIRI